LKYELPCPFDDKCPKGILVKADNSKTPSGLFECDTCHSMFRLVSITNKLCDVGRVVIPLKESKKKKV
jgi:hypothetical protein